MLVLNLVLFLLFNSILCDISEKKRINKDLNDYNDVDIERLYDQWDDDEENLEIEKNLNQKINLADLDSKDPEDILKLSKKGKTLMMFVNLNNNLSSEEVDKITGLWQTSLLNNHLVSERFILGENRVIYMFKDGSQAWPAKDFLIEQKEVKEVTIENKPYLGKYNTDIKQEL